MAGGAIKICDIKNLLVKLSQIEIDFRQNFEKTKKLRFDIKNRKFEVKCEFGSNSWRKTHKICEIFEEFFGK